MGGQLPSLEILGKLPDAEELLRLVENYPSYAREHRKALLHGYFGGRTQRQLVEDKLNAKGIDVQTCAPRSLGGHGRWVREKVKKTFVRILYLRYRLDGKGMTRIEANQQLLKAFGSDDAKDVGQSAIRKMTEGAKVDK